MLPDADALTFFIRSLTAQDLEGDEPALRILREAQIFLKNLPVSIKPPIACILIEIPADVPSAS